MRSSLPNYIRTFRRRSYLSQEELAYLLGATSGSTIVRHEAGQRVPSLERALAYAAALQVDPRGLFAGHFETQQKAVRVRAEALLERAKRELPSAEAHGKILVLEALISDPEPHLIPCEEE